MATPKIVEQQLREAEKLTQLTAPEGNGPQSVVTDVSQLAAPQPAPAAPTPTPAPAVAPSPQDSWEQRYRSLKGIFDQKVPELQAQTAAQASQIAALTDQVRTMTDLVKAKATEPKDPPKPTHDPRDVEQFGGDLVEMVHRYALQIQNHVDGKYSAAFENVLERIGKLEESVSGVREDTAVTRQSQFYATLGQLVPDYEQINVSEPWLNWLANVDSVYGVPRQAALDAAVKRLDAPRVAEIFKEFKAAMKPSAADQVQPNSYSGPGAPQATPARQLISQKAVQQFYTDVSRGRYRGREAEADRLEAEINLAISEGRITA